MKFNVQNEYGKLKDVVMFSKENLDLFEMFLSENVTRFTKGQKSLKEMLDFYGVNVRDVEVPMNAMVNGFPRDPFFVVGDTMYVSRRMEMLGGKVFSADNVKVIPEEARVDGGDVVVHNGTVFVGQGGLQTGGAGLEYMKRELDGKCNVVPIQMTKDGAGEKILHLDCVFNPISGDEAIAYTGGISDKSLGLLEKSFGLIDTQPQEQMDMACNVLSLGHRCIVSQENQDRLNEVLENKGYNVERINFGNTRMMRGSFRCATLPLVREM